jgi:hypothetical protein
MNSDYDENDFMPAQTSEQEPLPEPENKPRIKIETMKVQLENRW